METIYDWVTLAIFSGLIVLFLNRSVQDSPPDKLWHYLVASVGCAVTNYLGNEGYQLLSIVMLGAVIAFIAIVLKPFQKFNNS